MIILKNMLLKISFHEYSITTFEKINVVTFQTYL